MTMWNIILGLTLIVMVIVIWQIKKTLTGNKDREDVQKSLLTEITDLYEQDELTEEEYRKIKSKLVKGIQQKMMSDEKQKPVEPEVRTEVKVEKEASKAEDFSDHTT
jgi:type III secretory pathway component EscR